MLRVTDHFERSDLGRERRVNEDSYFARTPVFAVADGMGGAQAGEVASKMAIELFQKDLQDDGSSPEQRLADRAREANRRIYELSRHDAHRAGMGTTLTAAYVGEQDVSIAHVGDSRAYRLRDGELEQLTDDHSLVAELRKEGKITAEEAEDHPQRSIITRALGPEAYVDVDTLSFSARDGDVYLLCSDGLTSMISEDQVANILRSEKALADAGRALIAAANEAGGRDNITVILFRTGDVDGAGADQPTMVGAEAPRTETVLAQLPANAPDEAADEPAATPDESDRDKTVVSPVEPRRPRARSARRPGAVSGPRRRRPRWVTPFLAVAVLLGLVAAGGWLAIQSVYFIGTNKEGLVTVFRGLPYELPAGVHLYSTSFVSGVASGQLAAGRRRSLLDHKLRSHDDAADLVRRLELGELAAR
ncbi:MAG: family protein phosphatase [Solirubrobacteraceae bacterium]|jgi:protein phosphatase|nr:family protein phosphatase [Solirubrobacteraceae bacterium]